MISLLIFVAISASLFLLIGLMLVATTGAQIGLIMYWVKWWNESKARRAGFNPPLASKNDGLKPALREDDHLR